MRFIRHAHDQGRIDTFFNTVLVVNTVAIAIEGVYDINKLQEPFFIQVVDVVFAFIYLAEVVMKLSVVSFEEYWQEMANRFDFVSSILLAAGGVFLVASLVSPDGGGAAHLFFYLTLLRLLRVIRLVAKVEAFQNLCLSIRRMFVASADVLALNVIVAMLWASIGILMYGGLLHANNENLKGTAYVGAQYEIFNFNDMGLSCLTLFLFVVATYIDEFAGALAAVRPEMPLFGYVFFVSFHVVGVLMAFNIFVAFSIDIFVLEGVEGEGEKTDDDEKTDTKMSLPLLSDGEDPTGFESESTDRPKLHRRESMSTTVGEKDMEDDVMDALVDQFEREKGMRLRWAMSSSLAMKKIQQIRFGLNDMGEEDEDF